jgi:HNH endonuclease
MQNEELYTALAYFEYHVGQQGPTRHPEVFSRRESVAARVANKRGLTALWTKVSQDTAVKARWLESISRVECFLRKLKTVLIDRNVEGNVAAFLRTELEELVRSPGQRRVALSSQDIYFLWLMLSPLNLEMVRFHRLKLKAEMRELMRAIKAPASAAASQSGDLVPRFQTALSAFHRRYHKEDRKLKLGDEQRAGLVRSQQETCAISGAPVFVGDDVEVDHVVPLAIGGKDSIENLQVSTPEANRRKGPRPTQ